MYNISTEYHKSIYKISGELETWDSFIEARIQLWAAYFEGWIVNAQHPTHVVRYVLYTYFYVTY